MLEPSVFVQNYNQSQIVASSSDLPHAGIALILMPCLMVQKTLRIHGLRVRKVWRAGIKPPA